MKARADKGVRMTHTELSNKSSSANESSSYTCSDPEEYEKALYQLRLATRAYELMYGDKPRIKLVIGDDKHAATAAKLEALLNRLASS
jgi:hypothetical protein